MGSSKCLEKNLATEQVHDIVPRISIEHTAICGSEDSWTRHGDFACNSPQWIHLSLSCLVTLEPTLILLIYSILWWGGVTSSAFCCCLRFLVLIFEGDISGKISRTDRLGLMNGGCDSPSEDQTNVSLPLNKKPTAEHNCSVCLYMVKVLESGFRCKPFVMHSGIYQKSSQEVI